MPEVTVNFEDSGGRRSSCAVLGRASVIPSMPAQCLVDGNGRTKVGGVFDPNTSRVARPKLLPVFVPPDGDGGIPPQYQAHCLGSQASHRPTHEDDGGQLGRNWWQ